MFHHLSKPLILCLLGVSAASCASSPIKQLECNTEEGKLIDQIIFDPKEKVVYEYDKFSESLKPFEPSTYSFDEWEVAFTDSGKIKRKTVIKGGNSPYGLVEARYLTEFDLRKLTYHEEEIETNSKLKDFEDGDSFSAQKAIIDHNVGVINAGSIINKTTTKTIGICRYVTPKTTNVFDG